MKISIFHKAPRTFLPDEDGGLQQSFAHCHNSKSEARDEVLYTRRSANRIARSYNVKDAGERNCPRSRVPITRDLAKDSCSAPRPRSLSVLGLADFPLHRRARAKSPVAGLELVGRYMLSDILLLTSASRSGCRQVLWANWISGEDDVHRLLRYLWHEIESCIGNSRYSVDLDQARCLRLSNESKYMGHSIRSGIPDKGRPFIRVGLRTEHAEVMPLETRLTFSIFRWFDGSTIFRM